MLKHLYIRNFAIIDQLELDFDKGLTVLTGETGAGKSILLGALSLVLGDRADTDNIQQQADFAEIVAEFDVTPLSHVCRWLVTRELNVDNECILRRRITRDGRSRAYINSTPVNLQIIRELAEMLIDIHGQHEHQSIMKTAVQRQLLDDYACHPVLLKKVSVQFTELKRIEEQYQKLSQASSERNDRFKLLRFQTQELDDLALAENEYNQLNKRHKRMANAESLQHAVQQALYSLSEDENKNIQSEIAILLATLGKFTDIDSQLLPIIELMLSTQIQLDECVSLLQSYEDKIELEPQQLLEAEQRIKNILELSRKHQVTPEHLYTTHQELLQELSAIDHADEHLSELHLQCKQLEQQYLGSCETLTKSRSAAVLKLNKKITQSMQTLGMTGGKFAIEISENTKNRHNIHGQDKIEFTVTANSGQPLKPVSRIASGGELARISLAIQMIIAKTGHIASLIFDEVDSGIGGGIAAIVGQHLRTLGTTNQVICITHLPQVASQGHNHFRVEKYTQSKKTRSQVVRLNKAQRIEEISRMLSGVEITEQSRAHAEEMLGQSEP